MTLNPALVVLIEEARDRYHVPGVAVGIIHKNDVYMAGFGVTNVDHPLPVTEDTLFQIGSITKTMGVERKDPTLQALSPEQLAECAGRYTAKLTHLTIDAQDGGLRIETIPRGASPKRIHRPRRSPCRRPSTTPTKSSSPTARPGIARQNSSAMSMVRSSGSALAGASTKENLNSA